MGNDSFYRSYLRNRQYNIKNDPNNPRVWGANSIVLIPYAKPFLKVGNNSVVEVSVPNKMAALNLGNQVHYDPINGKPTLKPALPTELTLKYPATDFNFPRRGQKGADVAVVGGAHPSTYPGSKWDARNMFGDFKPGNASGAKNFKAEIKSGKLPKNTQELPYDQKTGKLQ